MKISATAGALPGSYACVNIRDPYFGRAIELLTYPFGFKGTRYNHAFVYLGAGLIAEAQPKGAKISPLDKYAGMDVTWSPDVLTPTQRVGICQTAKSLADAHVGYGFLDIFWLFLHITLGVKAGWLMKRILTESRMICSQMVSFCGKENGVDWNCGQEYAQEVTPEMLAART